MSRAARFPVLSLIHAGEVVLVGQQDPDLHDGGERCTGGLEDGLAVRQRQAGLLLDGWAGRLAGGGVNADEARDRNPALIPWLCSGWCGASGVPMTSSMCSTIASRGRPATPGHVQVPAFEDRRAHAW